MSARHPQLCLTKSTFFTPTSPSTSSYTYVVAVVPCRSMSTNDGTDVLRAGGGSGESRAPQRARSAARGACRCALARARSERAWRSGGRARVDEKLATVDVRFESVRMSAHQNVHVHLPPDDCECVLVAPWHDLVAVRDTNPESADGHDLALGQARVLRGAWRAARGARRTRA